MVIRFMSGEMEIEDTSMEMGAMGNGDFSATVDALTSIKEIQSYSCPLIYDSCNQEPLQRFEMP